MVEIIGNNIQAIINERMKKAEDPKATHDDLVAKLEKYIRRNRLTGLMKGNFSINAKEIWIVKEVLGCTADDVVVSRKITE